MFGRLLSIVIFALIFINSMVGALESNSKETTPRAKRNDVLETTTIPIGAKRAAVPQSTTVFPREKRMVAPEFTTTSIPPMAKRGWDQATTTATTIPLPRP
ncbi:hypothetical protein QR680_013937 [Steinernema hermaphroditum]|uniref:Uncharacterized protein n=1 Tax=Steinernema hermaphroditum TaxID=289476 RepID=A0AA39I8L1_9BILA|nr:hypothetical protein QR680_013937 [Steinernema hermaphroditum]